MAKSRFEYVKAFEQPDNCLQSTFIVVRVDGRGFHKFTDKHNFDKPNDMYALNLMDRAARSVMEELEDVILAFGESDEYSFLLQRSSNLYNRRRSKINSTIVSIFTASFVFHWNSYLPAKPLQYPPSFDSRVVLYPQAQEVRDYFSWRQADTHINNLQNTAFWALVHSGLTTKEANTTLQGTDSRTKQELLFSRFNINYNRLPLQFRKGSVLVRAEIPTHVGGELPIPSVGEINPYPGSGTLPNETLLSLMTGGESMEEKTMLLMSAVGTAIEGNPHGYRSKTTSDATTSLHSGTESSMLLDGNKRVARTSGKRKPYEGLTGDIQVLHEDIISDGFWARRPWLLA